MNTIYRYNLSFLFFLVSVFCLSAEYNVALKKMGDVRIMSFNVRYMNAKDTGNTHWSKRLPRIVKMIEDFQPDILGLQEAKKKQINQLMAKLPNKYTWFGKSRSAIPLANEEHNPIIYNADTVKLLFHGTYGLNDTFTVGKNVEKEYEAARMIGVGKAKIQVGTKVTYRVPRIFTVGKFQVKKGGALVTYINTHLTLASNEARKKQIGYIFSFLQKKYSKSPNELVMIGGDFNMSIKQVNPSIEGRFINTRDFAQQKSESKKTFVSWIHGQDVQHGEKVGRTIDFIVSNGKKPIKQHAVIQRTMKSPSGKELEMSLSDHRPLFVDVQMK